MKAIIGHIDTGDNRKLIDVVGFDLQTVYSHFVQGGKAGRNDKNEPGTGLIVCHTEVW